MRYTAPILTLARSGATSRAWDAFVAAGLDGAEDINALTLKGRLLKDRARQAAGAERAALYQQSGAAYAQAARLRPDSYPLINAAAMALFAGDGAIAASIARDVLILIDGDPAQGETPYWREATRAEALLLLGRLPEAQFSLSAAIARAPQAWEDHAVTLRQFAAILHESHGDTGWLNAHRPPASLHFSGILGVDIGDQAAVAAITAAIADIAPGFGYGALAAGADILAAEALLAARAELHVVLPSDPDIFRLSSVDPFGADWARRFELLIDAAHSVTICNPGQTTSRAGIALAEYRAMGMAAQRAALLESRAVAMRIEPAARPALGDPWLRSGRELVHVPVAAGSPVRLTEPVPDGDLRFLLALSNDAATAEPTGFASLAEAVAAIPGADYTAALDCTANGGGETVSDLLRSAGPGTCIASTDAAMALLAEGLARRIEPLGEMETAQKAIGVYAVWIDRGP